MTTAEFFKIQQNVRNIDKMNPTLKKNPILNFNEVECENQKS